MSSPTDAARGSAPSDPAELRRDIEEVRGELADTVNALAAKADVKGRAQHKAKEFKAQAMDKAQEVRAQAPKTAQQLAGVAQQQAQQAQQVVADKPRIPATAVGAALVVLGLLILRRRGRPAEGEGLVKLLYKPLGLVVSVLGGVLAGAMFKKIWKAVSGEDEAPEATSPEYSTKEVLFAAAVQGAIIGVVKAAVDRAGAKGFRKVTGTHPGK